MEFCTVTAVIADMPWTPWAVKVLRSAWMPAPPPESDPAMVSARAGTATSIAPYSVIGPAPGYRLPAAVAEAGEAGEDGGGAGRALEAGEVQRQAEARAHGGLGIGELPQPGLAVDAAKSGLPHPAERQGGHRCEHLHRVHAGHAGAQGAGEPSGPAPAEDRAAEAVGTGVCALERLVGVTDPYDRQHRAEGLLAHDERILGHVDQHHRVRIGRVHRAGPAHNGPRATAEGILQVASDHLELAGHGDRADVGVRLRARAQTLGACSDLVDEAVVDRVDDVDALDGDAGLAGVGDPAPDRRPGSRIQ